MNNPFKISFLTKEEINGTRVVMTADALTGNIAEYASGVLIREVIEKMAEQWVDKYGAEIIDSLSPEDVQKAMKTHLAKKLLGDR